MIRKFSLNKIFGKTTKKAVKNALKSIKKQGAKKEANLWQNKRVYGIIIK